jgi:prepilin-type N-terminal cleavage/methylation domain-containing protein
MTVNRRGPAVVAQRQPMPASPRNPKTRQPAAFTLLELLAVIGLIAVLTGIVIGVGQRALESGRTSRARAELATLAALLETYKAVNGDYPRTSDPAHLLQSLLGRRGPDYQPVSAQPLLEAARFTLSGDPFADESAVLVDPWGHPYFYAYKSPPGGWTNPGYVLGSAGPDGAAVTALRPGGFADVAAAGNTDNLYANQP